MAFRTVLRVARADNGQDEPDFVLVHITSEGQNDLDLKLIGTNNSEVFSVSLKQSQTSKLKAKSNKSTPEEWNDLLLAILLGTAPDGTEPANIDGVESTARVDAQSLTITIQKRIEGITQKLGTISLPSNEEEEIDVFDWCGKTVQARDHSRHELEALKTTIIDKDARIKKLEDTLTELTNLKRENETQLLEKFSLLLNEKKLKIRDQQRLLAGATVDPEKVEEVEESRLAVRSRDAGPSRKGKRKATSKAEPSDDESDVGFEKMEVDGPVADESDQEQRNTSDEDTATQSEDEDNESLPPPKRKPAEVTEKPSISAKAPTPTEDQVPPKRVLPFASKLPAQRPKPQEDGSETESDDEL